MKEHVKLNDRLGQQKAAKQANLAKFMGVLEACVVALKDAVSPTTPLCYVEYRGDSLTAEQEAMVRAYEPLYGRRTTISMLGYPTTTHVKRVFPTYNKAIAHLTALKLSAIEEDEEYKELKPCKLVQGYRTKSGKEVIEKTQELTDERSSMGRKEASVRQPSQQRRLHIPVPQTMGGTISKAISKKEWLRSKLRAKRAAERAAIVRSSRTTTTGGIATEMDAQWASNIVSDFYRNTTLRSI